MNSSPISFGGFPSLEANFTPVPNIFFDFVVPNFPECVIKVVAVIIRATLGWNDPVTGERRIEAELSLSDIQRRGQMSRSAARDGVRKALESGLITETAGAYATAGSRYALRWADEERQRITIERHRKATDNFPLVARTMQAEDQSVAGGVRNSDRYEIQTGTKNDPVEIQTPYKRKRSSEKKPLGLSEKETLNVERGNRVKKRVVPQEETPNAPETPVYRSETSAYRTRETGQIEQETGIYRATVLDAVNSIAQELDDPNSWARYRQLREICIDQGATAAWEEALAKTRQRQSRQGTAALSKPGAYFQTTLLMALDKRGVTVPSGSATEREEVRSLISGSLGGAQNNRLEDEQN